MRQRRGDISRQLALRHPHRLSGLRILRRRVQHNLPRLRDTVLPSLGKADHPFRCTALRPQSRAVLRPARLHGVQLLQRPRPNRLDTRNGVVHLSICVVNHVARAT
ncbi:hypothetical protein MAV100_25975 [Mycobacterium avium subsp. hominissuis 100]|nr:hypothetical protein MAV100_25975 [Mycobacterium avium subsp. hominissuis 100]